MSKDLVQIIMFLRQWINEDKVTESSRLTTNTQIAVWFKDILSKEDIKALKLDDKMRLEAITKAMEIIEKSRKS